MLTPRDSVRDGCLAGGSGRWAAVLSLLWWSLSPAETVAHETVRLPHPDWFVDVWNQNNRTVIEAREDGRLT